MQFTDLVDRKIPFSLGNLTQPPAERVRFILGGEDNEVERPIFSEMDVLCCNENGVEEWKETARWLKFEEDVEEGGNRWSKPHVATLSLYSLFELRSCIMNGTVLLDLNASTLPQIAGNEHQLFYDQTHLFLGYSIFHFGEIQYFNMFA